MVIDGMVDSAGTNRTDACENVPKDVPMDVPGDGDGDDESATATLAERQGQPSVLWKTFTGRSPAPIVVVDSPVHGLVPPYWLLSSAFQDIKSQIVPVCRSTTAVGLPHVPAPVPTTSRNEPHVFPWSAERFKQPLGSVHEHRSDLRGWQV